MAKENIAFFPKPCYTDTVKNIFRLLLQMPHISCASRGILTAAITTGEETVSMLELQNICYRVSTPDGEQDILKDISISSQIHCSRCNYLLSKCIDRRIRNLCKELFKIIKQRNRLS